jgi:hypothetical protein
MEHVRAALRTMAYIKGTIRLHFVGFQPYLPSTVPRTPDHLQTLVFADSDWATCPDTRRSMSGYVITIEGSPVVWGSKKQPIVAKSTMAAEYIAASVASDDAISILKFLDDVGIASRPLPLICDNVAASKFCQTPSRILK